MGPRFVNRGCVPGALQARTNAWLQWGRGLLTADAGAIGTFFAPGNGLQWGRGLLTADAVLAFLICWIPFVLQWGRGLLTADAMSGRA